MHHINMKCKDGIELTEIRPGQCVRVHMIAGGWHIRQRLNQMGIHIGDRICVKQAGAFHGPLLVEVHGSMVALGCNMARKIIVEIVKEENRPDEKT